ncbi:hypothetical protein C0Q70_19719 [Pomacea canaliculata]|uniref:VWFA domain-containing protein n=1 Tax=Pomacea canaliculata TaxID=400727 RepID=A0A2T7NDI7_POMCA|nr:hypothetical protein C0Q70_19719 [Pomacea canaliculata]
MAREEEATNPAPNPLCHVTGCRAKPADVYFVLDTASGTSDAAVQQQQQFLASLAALFPLSKTAVRVGIISVGHRPEVTARLGRKDKMADLQQAVHSTPRVGGLPDIAQALRYLRLKAFAPDTARKEVAHAVIMMTNGNSLNAKEAAAEAELLRGQGVYLYAVSTSADQKVDKTELMRLASQPADKFVYDTSDYNIVESLIDLLHVELCNCK